MTRWILILAAAASMGGTVCAQEKKTADTRSSQIDAPEIDAPEIDTSHWVAQLGHDQYLRRETASQRLVEAGPVAIAELVGVIREGDLEVVERAMNVITRIAMTRPPHEDGGAWENLNRLATKASGRAASSAMTAIEEIRAFRASQAKAALSDAGVFIGTREFVAQAIGRSVVVVGIDEKWQGDTKSLQWLQWLRGIENARIKGPAIRRDVLEMVAQLPQLKTLVLVDGKVDAETLVPLCKIPRLDSLRIWYVPLTDEDGDMIATMPIRVSLSLMGTGISKEKVDSMRVALPGLPIEHHQGGYLGVQCTDSLDACRISSVVPESAAEQAGLLDGDVIVQVDETNINIFRDLRAAINQHVSGDEVEVKYRRGEKIQGVKLRLRRLQDP